VRVEKEKTRKWNSLALVLAEHCLVYEFELKLDY
jgi:hypothetical protein